MSAFDTLNSALDLAANYRGTMFHGVVVSTADPLNLDRVQARVPGLYDPDLGDIPWIGPIKYSPFGCGASWGVYGVPAVGSDVQILLQDGDPNYPVYQHLQRTANSNFPSGSSWGFIDPNGNMLRFKDDGDIILQATAGVTIHISPNGSLSIVTEGSTEITSGGSTSITTSGSTTIQSGGAVSIDAPAVNISSDVTVSGSMSVGGSVTNAGVNIGSTHVHSGVRSGPNLSGTPE